MYIITLSEEDSKYMQIYNMGIMLEWRQQQIFELEIAYQEFRQTTQKAAIISICKIRENNII